MSRFTLSRRLAVSFLLLAFPSLLHSQTAPNEPSSLRPDYMTYYIGDNHGTGNGFNKGYYKEKLKGGDLEYAGYLACDLAIAYLDGVDGNKKIKPNEQEALKWLQNIPLSAMKKQPCDYGHIGYRLLGQGKPAIPANPAEAERWLTIAATSDIYTREPRYNLGVAYLRGDIIPRDNAKAVHFIKQASDEHLSWAMILYAELLTEGKLVPQNLNQAQRLLTMAKAHAESEEDAYQSELQQKGELDAELARMDAQHHAEMLGVISQGLANMANVAATPTATQTASNQAQANIAAAGAQDQALAAQRALENARRQQAATPSPKPTPSYGVNTRGSSGTAAPPIAYATTTSTQGTIVQSICPASGFVPGAMIQNGDTAVGVPCTPGQPIGSAPTTPIAATPPGTGGYHTAQPLFSCIAQTYVNNEVTFTNSCNVPVYVEWWVGTHSGSWTIAPGDHQGSGYTSSDVSAAGGSNYYPCPAGYSPADASGHHLTQAVSNFQCIQRN